MSSPPFALHLATARKPHPKDGELAFGRVFTDHMALVDYEAGRGWTNPRVVPYAPLALDPAAAVLHYAQSMFDGLKAFRGADGRIRFFRLDRHCRRLHDGADRLCIPAIDEDLVRGALVALVGADRDWVAVGARNFALPAADDHRDGAVFGRPSRQAFPLLRHRVAGGCLPGRGVVFSRAHPGRGHLRPRGGGGARRRQGGRELHRQPQGRRGGQGARLRPGAVDRRPGPYLSRGGRHDEPLRAHRRRAGHATARGQHPRRRHARLGADVAR